MAKLFPYSLPLAIGQAAYNLYQTQQVVNKGVQEISRQPFANSTSTFTQPIPRTMPVVRARPYKGRRVSRRCKCTRKAGRVASFHRTTNPGAIAIASGSDKVIGTYDFKLDDVYTADLLVMYDSFRVKKIVTKVTPLIDAANSGISNNMTSNYYLGNEPSGNDGVNAEPRDICRYSNNKHAVLPSGKVFYYTYYPKALNSVVGSGGTAVSVGNYAGSNPWLSLNASGIAIPHHRLHYGIKTSQNAAANGILFQLTHTVYFDCIGSR